MHQALKTTLALFFAGVIHSLAQTHEAATAALQNESYKFTAPEAIELKNRIIAKDKVSQQEADFVMQHRDVLLRRDIDHAEDAV